MVIGAIASRVVRSRFEWMAPFVFDQEGDENTETTVLDSEAAADVNTEIYVD